MAGAGVRLFTAGSVLTASQVNQFLMDQVVARFPDSASRDAAFGGLGEPSLSEGRLCYLDSDNKLYVNVDGTSLGWVEVGVQPDLTISAKTSNYIISLSDKNLLIEMNVGAANTLTIPTNASVPFPIGSSVNVIQLGTGKTQIVPASGVTLLATPGAFLRARYSLCTLIKRGTNEWYAVGDLSAT